jgi:AAA ATPase-like protein
MAWANKLVGRGAELVELQRVKAGEFRIVLLVGDPGIGRTRLAREFLARSHDRVVGLLARAYPLGETASATPTSLTSVGANGMLATVFKLAERLDM